MRSEQQEALDKGINLFNERRYFEAHEEWESEWRLMSDSDDRTFFQGLIFAAGSFLHYVRQECAGARELLEKSIEYLRSGIEDHPDVNVGEFVGRLERLRERFSACTFDMSPADLPLIRRNLVSIGKGD
jgi:hypothetical protein